jgi:(R)-amidase
MENQVFLLMANRCGSGDGGLSFHGESALVDPFGESVASAQAEATQLAVRLDLTRIAASRLHYDYLHDARVPLALRAAQSTTGARAVEIERSA